MARELFPGLRAPLTDDASETERKFLYWQWLDAGGQPPDMAKPVAVSPEAGNWVALVTSADADFEAFYMRHSIGHSWDKYSSFGQIFGLRSPSGLPEATILMSGGKVVHAREHQNARLSAANSILLDIFAAEMGFEVVPDRLAFDTRLDSDGANTRVGYLCRMADGSKAFSSEVVAGRVSPEWLAAFVEAVQDDCAFEPDAVGFPMLNESGHGHELCSLSHTDETVTTRTALADLTAGWSGLHQVASAPTI